MDERLPDGTPALNVGNRGGQILRFLRSPAEEDGLALDTNEPATRERRVYPGGFEKFGDLLKQVQSPDRPVPEQTNPYHPTLPSETSATGPSEVRPQLFSAGTPPPEFPSTPAPRLPYMIDLGRRAPAGNSEFLSRYLPSHGEEVELSPLGSELGRGQRRSPILQKTGDTRADLSRYASELENYRNPEDSNGRWKSAGLAALRGALRGLAAGGLGGALGGAIGEGIHGVVTPNLDERERRDEEIARTYGRLGRMNEMADAALKRQMGQATLEHTQAETDALRNPRVKPNYQLRDTADGVVAVDMNDPTKAPVKVAGLKGTAANYSVQKGRDGKMYAVNTKDPQDVVTLPFEAEPSEDFVSVPGYGRMRASAAYGADRSVEGANITANNQYGNQTFEDSKEATDRKYQNDLAVWQDAQKAIGEHRTKRAALFESGTQARALEKSRAGLQAEIAALEKKEDKGDADEKRLAKLQDRLAREDERYDALIAQNRTQETDLVSYEAALNEQYGQLVKRNPDGSYALTSGRPNHPGYGRRQPPQMRRGGSSQGGTVTGATPSNVLQVIQRIRNRQ